MNRRLTIKRLAVGLLVAAAGLSLVASAAATVPGRNGRIAFTSGRDGANDNLAQLYALNPSRPDRLGSPFSIAGIQNRHPSWSPDRTKVVFAAGTPGSPTTEDFDLFVRDFVANTTTRLDANETNSNDHPAWSPDGTRIAYEHQPAPGSADRDIKVKTFPSGAPAVNLTTGGPIEFKPAWSPDSRTILYAAQKATPPASNLDIVKRPASGGSETPVRADSGVDEYQPAVSPDGSKLCYTRQSTPGNTTTAEITIVDLPDLGGQKTFSNDPSKGDINCTFSPDGKRIAYVNGVFSQGRLVMKPVADPAAQPTELADDTGSNNFDGNPDWAPDGSPDCPDRTVNVPAGTTSTIQIECTDTGPEYERTDPNGFVATGGGPQNGTTSDEQTTANPSTVRYTPKAGFSGTDRIVYSAFDDFGFGTDQGTITINVQGPGGGGAGGGTGGGPGGGAARPMCAGRTATVVGTPGNDRLNGTRGPDVIVALGGNDRVRAGRGNDIVCAGPGRDRVGGGSGNDRIGGGAGNDRLNGEAGRDRVSGESGNDRVAGGSGRDRLSGGSGRDRLDGGRARDRCAGGSGRDRASRCETRSRIP